MSGKDLKILKKMGTGFCIGIGIALTLATIQGQVQDIKILAGYILTGIIMGTLIPLGNIFIIKLIKQAWLNMIAGCMLSVTIFLAVMTSVQTLLHQKFIENLFYPSIGTAIVTIMIFFFNIYSNEKDERLRLEKENRELAVIRERNRIARELHDSVSQNLFGINLKINSVNTLMEKEPGKAREIITQLAEMIGEVQAEMRLMIHELNPMPFTAEGFWEALENLIHLFMSRYNLDIAYHLDEAGEELDNKTKLVLYRIIQESLNNIIKHAGADKVEVNLEVTGKHGVLTIQDNGRGFVPGGTGGQCLGIRGMKERVEGIGGQFGIDSQPGAGTIVKVSF